MECRALELLLDHDCFEISFDERSVGQRPVPQVASRHCTFAPEPSDACRDLRSAHIGPHTKRASQEQLPKVSTISEEPFPLLSGHQNFRPVVVGIPLVPGHTLGPRARLRQALSAEGGQQQFMVVHLVWVERAPATDGIPPASAEPC